MTLTCTSFLESVESEIEELVLLTSGYSIQGRPRRFLFDPQLLAKQFLDAYLSAAGYTRHVFAANFTASRLHKHLFRAALGSLTPVSR
ncbi:MAG TPA: hypothetical protein EYQ63_25645 [Fuerstia sp.]|nr:hypothetical protein [Fuerstiella sp.]